jgi:integrase
MKRRFSHADTLDQGLGRSGAAAEYKWWSDARAGGSCETANTRGRSRVRSVPLADRCRILRAKRDTRPVPVAPELVQLIRAHLDEFGTTKDGRLFRGAQGGPLGESTYGRAWKAARRAVLTPAQVESPLAGRPYDLRHAAVSLWLNAGVAPQQVAEWAGHSVHVLLKVYAKCVDGEQQAARLRIENALKTA